MRRLLQLEPAAVGSAAAAVYVAVTALWLTLVDHQSALRPDELVAAVSGVWGLWTRRTVTPLADPRDAAGRPLSAPLGRPRTGRPPG